MEGGVMDEEGLRDLFAFGALIAMAPSRLPAAVFDNGEHDAALANACYRLADEMLLVRKRRPPESTP
jgi:hypothetical protein